MENSGITLTVYGKPRCVQCTATERYLDSRGVKYNKIDVTKDEAAMAYVMDELGYQQAPVVYASEDHHWSGFIPDELAKYV